MIILLVEDSDLDAFVAEKALSNLERQVRVVRATNAAEAIEQAQSADEIFDAVLLDQNLAGDLGTSLIEPLKHIRSVSGAPIIMLTSDDTDKAKSTSLACDADAFILKPLDATYLEKMLSDKNVHWQLKYLPENLDAYRELRHEMLMRKQASEG